MASPAWPKDRNIGLAFADSADKKWRVKSNILSVHSKDLLLIVGLFAMAHPIFGQETVNWNSIPWPWMTAQTNSTIYSPLFGGGSTGGGSVGLTVSPAQSFYCELLYNTAFTGFQIPAPTTISEFVDGTWLDTGLGATNSGFVGRLRPINPGFQMVPWAIGTTNNIILVGWSANLGTNWSDVVTKLANWANNPIPFAYFGMSATGYIAPEEGPPGSMVFGHGPDADGLPINSPNTQLYLLPYPQIITSQPASQSASPGSSVTFSVSDSGAGTLYYQWYFDGNPISGATNASLTITSIQLTNDGNYSVVLWNVFGSVNSATASLKLVGVDTSLACYLMTVTPLPDRQSGKNNLVVVTHGMQPGENQPQWLAGALGGNDISWITNVSDAISQQLSYRGSNDWQVVPYNWVSQAGLPSWTGVASDIATLQLAQLAEPALANAEKIGTQIGRQIASQGWSHVHLIAHSAGAGLIQAATDAIHVNAPNTVIQTTFLDPFLGADHRGLSQYGVNANWSDNYFSHDKLTGSYTEGTLVHAYNVDVTWLDPNAQITYVSQGLPYLGTTTTTPLAYSSHGWPHDFYSNSVAGALSQCATNCGFIMSEEDGNWNNLGNFAENNTPGEPCGMPVMVQNPIFANVNPQLSFEGLATALSGSGANLSGNWFTLASSSSQVSPQGKIKFNGQPQDNAVTNSTGTTAWFAVGLTITNFVNFIQFDAMFTDSNNAEGLLTVYWDTNQIGTVDERVASPGLQTCRLFLPNTVTNSVYVLGFRLDSFNNTSSSIMVTNVATGFVGITTPLTLGISLTNAAPLLQLTGASNYNYLVETSTNLVGWTPTALLVNSNGTVLFSDSTATNSSMRFYRTTMP